MKQFHITEKCANNKCNNSIGKLVSARDVDLKVYCHGCKKDGE